MTVLFGGDACPLGLSVQFIDAPEADVVAALPGQLANVVSKSAQLDFARSLQELLPFQSPWTRMLTASAGRWTALVNNGLNGGDSTAPGPAIMRSLGVACVVATHVPPFGPGHAQTQLQVFGPTGVQPLMGVRSISAVATDGRWQWWQSGRPFAFENTARYQHRVIRKRFDRLVLVEYLESLGIPAEDSAYGNATVHQQQVTWTSQEVTLAEARADFNC